MGLRFSVSQMAHALGVLFKIVLPGGELLLGRVVSRGYMGGNLSTAAFRVYDDYQQFQQQEMEHERKEVTIHDGQFIVVQRVTEQNFDQSSTYERILSVDADIHAFKDDYHDFGIIVRNLPAKLQELKDLLATFHEEQRTVNTELVEGLLDSHITECRKCPPTWGKSLEEDEWYKMTTIRQAKYYAREAVMIALSVYKPREIHAAERLWTA
jgi:hypothetical protein